MARAARVRFDDLPLFADDREIARAVVGESQEKIANWLASLRQLEQRGFPEAHPLYGRYTPAVRQFYDSQHAPPPPRPAPVRDRDEDAEAWRSRRRARQA